MKKTLVVLAAAGLLAACSSSTTDSTPSSSTASGEPSSALIAWAGQVCTDTSTLKTSITDIGSAVTSGGADLQASIGQQSILIQQSADALLTTVGAIPESDASSPDAIAIQQSSDALNAAVAALGTSVTDLTDTSGIAFAKALVNVGSAASDAGQAAIDSVEAIDAAIKNRTASIGKAFQASPSCTELTAEKP
ncbi:MAG: hypothetical protein Q8L05_07955 [Actinomycetota bacterium]|nr:hypothetical protein [Actinomycetota bacterium]MDP2287651.1 hypothetical protein [Actinomycetota bacterium]